MTARRALIALGGVAALAAAPALAGAASSSKRTVTVNDNYYQPGKLTVKAGTTVRWLWSEDESDVHDVKLDKAPKGVKKFQSDALAAGESYSKKLTKPGKYHFICTFHEEAPMVMTITVKKAAKKK